MTPLQIWRNTRLSEGFLLSVMAETGFADNPLYAVLHESIYAQGAAPTAFAAGRVRDEFPRFDPAQRPLMLTGEMIYPWMFEEIRALRPFRAAAEALALRGDNPPPLRRNAAFRQRRSTRRRGLS